MKHMAIFVVSLALAGLIVKALGYQPDLTLMAITCAMVVIIQAIREEHSND